MIAKLINTVKVNNIKRTLKKASNFSSIIYIKQKIKIDNACNIKRTFKKSLTNNVSFKL